MGPGPSGPGPVSYLEEILPSLSDIKRTYFIQALGLPSNTPMSNTDLESKFFSVTTGAGGAFRYGFNAKQLPKWNAAMMKVRDGVADAKIMTLGDSQFAGIGTTLYTTFPSTGSPMARLVQLFNNMGLPSAMGMTVPATDQRWTLGVGWSATLFGVGSLACFTSAPSANTLVLTDNRVVWDRADVYYLRGAGLGTVNAIATGGASVPINTLNGSSDIAKTTISAASASASNTVTINISGATSYVVGVELYNSTSFKVRVGNGGVGTVGAQQHVVNPTTWGSIPFINTMQPDLVILGLGVNDRGASRTPNQFKADMQQLVTAIKLVCDVVITSEMPAQSAPQATNEADYNAVMAQMALDNGVPYYAYCERCINWTTYNTLGLAFDGLHQNNKGYWDWANGLAGQLVNL